MAVTECANATNEKAPMRALGQAVRWSLAALPVSDDVGAVLGLSIQAPSLALAYLADLQHLG
ncbi:hypothetical protein [Halothiobacillus sp. DCM-1]|uniref:hypothetical protein n=1 Tax=Halothiobacillus sp. DCM-1 TaxID=3112558 RepID=UPI003250E5D6